VLKKLIAVYCKYSIQYAVSHAVCSTYC